ncbi:dihydrodipicolinate synthase family protein [Oscillibacter sp. MSJ-2]|uniref:Dihydrodipicolinate synthase family protein n=1 Tax=Dysosmobacter acutus TaxID=2841504 RepID=A0ABS6F5F8_9FIRM|nr:dihydrodipicolinate synthase family protein [Dysosmobacter acutus]MBU5625531.1 dihydrodipicolinate synthase family protein [Dysosmobacter acutus]
MKGKTEPRGVIATVITPFDEAGNIDYESLEREFQWGLDAGLTGFLVPCGASEIKYLTLEEQISLFTTAKKICGDQLFLMPNLPGPTEKELVEQSKLYLDLGADGLNINTHWSPRKGPAEDYIKLVQAVDALHPDFLCLQDDDLESGDGIPVEVAARLFNELESVRALKCDLQVANRKCTALKAATGNEMLYYGADESHHSLEGYDRGLDGLMPSGMFEIFSNIYKLYHNKSREAGARLFFDSLPCVCFTRQPGLNRIYHKYYMKRTGVFKTTYSRDPQDNYDAYTTRYREEMITRALDIAAHIDEYWK